MNDQQALAAKRSNERQDRNGVRVSVHREDDGSVVTASCSCFGHPMRCHSDPNCPNLRGDR